MEFPSEDNVVALLELWSLDWKHRGRQRAIGSGSYEQYCTLGLFAYGGNDPCLSKASANKEACVALNHFLRNRFPDATWTSIAVVLNPRIGLHRDILNMIGKPNHAIALGFFTGGRIWVEDDDGTSPEVKVTKHNTRQLWGSWIDMHDGICKPTLVFGLSPAGVLETRHMHFMFLCMLSTTCIDLFVHVILHGGFCMHSHDMCRAAVHSISSAAVGSRLRVFIFFRAPLVS